MKKLWIVMLSFVLLVGCSVSPVIELLEDVQETIVLELGEVLSMEPDLYISMEGIEVEDVFVYLENYNSEDEFLNVGEYVLIIEYDEQQILIPVEVVDTTAPVIQGVVDLETTVGVEIDLIDHIEVIELSAFDLTVTEIDFDEAGEYELVYTVVDAYSNETSEKATLTIVEDEVVEEENETASTTTSSSSNSSSSNSSSSSSSSSSSNSSSSNSSSNSSSSNSSSSSGSSSSDSSSSGTTSGPTFTSSDTSAEADMLAALNAERASLGLSPLVYSSSIYEGCKIRAMELTELYSHSRPNGGSWADVASNVWAENICYSSLDFSGSYAVSRFMTSTTHRANMMSSSYTKFACKRVVYNGIAYWVQLFGT